MDIDMRTNLYVDCINYNVSHDGSELCSELNYSVTPFNSSILVGKNHFWRVRGKNSIGWGEWISVQRFDISAGAVKCGV